MIDWGAINRIKWLISQSNDTSSDEEGDVTRFISGISKNPIAEGGFSDLYLGHHRSLGTVVLKRPRSITLDPVTARRFHREVSPLTRLGHKNLLPFLGTCIVGSCFYTVSPYMKNGDLKQWVDKGCIVEEASILYQVSDAVDYLHQLGIVHGDIKAQNVLLADDETPKLSDFGLVGSWSTLHMDEFGPTNGLESLRWSAPELFENQPTTKESDIYAFGMLIVEVLTQKPPLYGVSDYAVVDHVLNNNGRPVRPETLDRLNKLWDLAEKCWARNPSDRPIAIIVKNELIPENTHPTELGIVKEPTKPWDAKEGGSAIHHSDRSTAISAKNTLTPEKSGRDSTASQLPRIYVRTASGGTIDQSSTETTSAWNEFQITDLTGKVHLPNTNVVASGGFCVLYAGYDESHAKVALRRLDHTKKSSKALHRFVREAALWFTLSHPNILPLLGKCTIGQHVYMVSPFIENGNLSECLQKGHDLDRRGILYQIAGSVAYLHEKEVIHGDIKASNVLISDNHVPLLCDFGLAKEFSWTTTTDVKGTGSVRWMAPELFLEEKKTCNTDVYAFGIMIGEVLSGELPFSDVKIQAVLPYQVIYMDKRPLREPLEGPNGQSFQACWDTAEKCWDKTPSSRPSMKQVMLELA